jgi:casein kinase 1
MLIHILTPGGLHWTRNGVPRTEEEHDRLKIAKRGAKPEDLCRGMPSEFEEFLRYTRKLRFSELPNYEQWREEFRDLMLERGYSGDEAFIWPPPPPPTVSNQSGYIHEPLTN